MRRGRVISISFVAACAVTAYLTDSLGRFLFSATLVTATNVFVYVTTWKVLTWRHERAKACRYRLRLRLFGFEPQMRYQAGFTGRYFWAPLNRAGYWVEPEAFESGKVTKKSVMSLCDARCAVERARLINETGRVAKSA